MAGVVGFPIFGPQIDKTKVMRNIVAGNWKSNKLMGEAQEWMDGMAEWLASHEGVEVMVGAPAPYLAALSGTAPEGLHILAQNVSAEGHGAHTGEFTADMLKSCGVAGAIVGHSERRARFGDTDDKVKAKVQALVDEGLQAVFCCGETLEEREAGRQEDVVHAQLKAAVAVHSPPRAIPSTKERARGGVGVGGWVGGRDAMAPRVGNVVTISFRILRLTLTWRQCSTPRARRSHRPARTQ